MCQSLKMHLDEINFSLVNFCNAKCIFCPRSEFEHKTKFMPLRLLERIVDEILSKDFPFKILLSHIGENGESTLHPELVDALRIIKRIGHYTDLYTNFSHLTDQLITIFDKNLLNSFHTNIDGLTSRSYYDVKGLDYNTVENNILNFLKLRNKRPFPLFIHIITTQNYAKSVESFFGARAFFLSKNRIFDSFIENEAQLIKEKWEKHIEPGLGDKIGIDSCLMWAERDHIPKLNGNFTCYNIERLKHAAFIAPNGDWYFCCFDIKNQLVLGNLYKESLVDLANSNKRKEIIEMLEAKKFNKVGPPCDRVDCCQVVRGF